METNKKTITPEEGLQSIQKMIANAQRQIGHDGFEYLFWGSAAILCSILNYFLLKNGYPNSSMAWLLMPALIPVNIIYRKKVKRYAGTKSHFRKVNITLWVGFGIAMAVIIFVSGILKVSPYPILLVLIGFTTFTSGSIIQFRPLQIGAVAFFGLAIWSALSSIETQCLLYVVALFMGYIIPGIMLKQKVKNSHV